ncbi:MAG TPA: FAD/NAD(P)-binding protein [Gemmataceae bacterium]|nr:FAD/NAD(P)-binding protein [Gemmataceae bacterium]
MRTLLVVGGGLFGSLAAACARSQGIEVRVFDPGLPGAASPAAAGLFKEGWIGKKFRAYYDIAVPLLDRLFGLRQVTLAQDDGRVEQLFCVPPTAILDPAPCRERVSRVGDGWLEAGGIRYEGWIYVAAGVWCGELIPDVQVYGKAGAAFLFEGERPGRIRPLAPGRQAIAFVRDRGITYFSDGTAERTYTDDHDRLTLERAAALGLTAAPIRRCWGRRPYTPGGPLFRPLGERTWLGTGGRKMGTIVGAAFAYRLVEELRNRR